MSTTSPLLAELAAIRAYIEGSRAILKDGFMPDISSLEPRISAVCLGIQAAGMEEQAHYLPELASLLKVLDECERELRAWNDANTMSGKI